MHEDERLRALTEKARYISTKRRPRFLSDILGEYLQEQVGPQHDEFSTVKEAWEAVVPAGLAGVCRLGDVSRGRVRVLVSSPAYLYEIRFCSDELLSELQKRCGRKLVKKLKFEIG